MIQRCSCSLVVVEVLLQVSSREQGVQKREDEEVAYRIGVSAMSWLSSSCAYFGNTKRDARSCTPSPVRIKALARIASEYTRLTNAACIAAVMIWHTVGNSIVSKRSQIRRSTRPRETLTLGQLPDCISRHQGTHNDGSSVERA